tara:strand:+ start:196 stop:372 length:177 start_codon:yes stop_codon:yes gene_type:complete
MAVVRANGEDDDEEEEMTFERRVTPNLLKQLVKEQDLYSTVREKRGQDTEWSECENAW